jgi:plasmid replication initiation protein
MENKLILRQTNKVTNARYDFTALEKDVMYLINRELQKYQKEGDIEKNLFEEFKVVISIKELAGTRHHREVLDAIENMAKQVVKFEYTTDGKDRHLLGTPLIHWFHHKYGTSTVELWVPYNALKFMLNTASGFTLYNHYIALGLKSKYAKRLYDLCCEYKDTGGFAMSVAKFRAMFMLEKQYSDITALRQRVLDPAREELRSDADVWFDYSITKKDSRSFNQMAFKVYSNHNKDTAADKGVYNKVWGFLTVSFPSQVDDKAKVITDTLLNQGMIMEAWRKFERIAQGCEAKEMTKKHVVNTTIKILREDFNIKK